MNNDVTETENALMTLIHARDHLLKTVWWRKGQPMPAHLADALMILERNIDRLRLLLGFEVA